jgi:hypothetical protein
MKRVKNYSINVYNQNKFNKLLKFILKFLHNLLEFMLNVVKNNRLIIGLPNANKLLIVENMIQVALQWS